jgi:ubiquinone/menaquinone biosynthesis C-methylase UbiE
MDYNKIANNTAVGRLNAVDRRSKVINELISLLNELRSNSGGDLIDIGSGTGDSLYRILPVYSFNSITCLDNSEAMINKGRELSSELGLKINYIISNVENIPLKDNCFDIALMNSMIHHIKDLNKALISVRRILRNGGALGIYTLSHEQINNHHLVRFFPRIAELNKERYPKIDYLKEKISNTGFKIIKIKPIEFVTKVESKLYLKSVINKYGSVLHLLTKHEFDTGIANLTKFITEEYQYIIINAKYTIIGAV